VVSGAVAEIVEGDVAELPGELVAEVAETVRSDSGTVGQVAAEENLVA
jgi:hypothetical protein